MLVLLPGVHGTKDLFEPLTKELKELDYPSMTIELPENIEQSVDSLAQHVTRKLPQQPHIIVAESFSGCLIPNILGGHKNNTFGVIFVVSCISCPNKITNTLASFIPAWVFENKTLLTFGLRCLFLNGYRGSKEFVNYAIGVVHRTPAAIIKQRINILNNLKPPIQKFNVPVVYIQATKDRAVGASAMRDIEKTFPTKVIKIEGPHFLLQVKPREAAMAIKEGLDFIQGYSSQH